MKGIIKLFPAALAVFALASCSNEDFFGSENASGKLQLEATVEAPNSDDGTTRAAFLFTANGNSSLWESGDEFRVYDAALQKYDNFVCDGSVIAVDGTPVVAEHSKAIFPGDQVYYAGYDKDNDDVIAIMDVPFDVEFGGLDKAADGTAYYKSGMPMWGDVTDATSSNLKVELKTLSAFTDIAVYQKSVKYIRVLAAANADTNDESTVVGTTKLATATIDEIVENDILDAKTPLAGYFEAQLKTGGVLKANTKNPVVKNSYKSYVTVDLSQNAADEAHIYIPIIAGVKYTNLIIQTSADGTTWTALKAYKGVTFERNGALRKDLVCGKAPITAVVSSLEDLNTKLATICGTDAFKGRTVNITASGDIKTSTECDHLDIPAGMTADQVVNFNFPIDDTDNPLTITGGTASKTMTINLNQGISGNTAVNIHTIGKLVLTGSINSSREDQYKKINVEAAQELTFGSAADFKSFSTNMDIVSDKNFVIDAGEGQIANVVLSGTAELTVKSGKVTKVASASSGAMEIAGGEVTTIEKTDDEGNVTIGAAKVGTLEAKNDATFATTVTKGAEITDLKLAKSTGNVSITDAAVASLDTKAGTIGITSTEANATVTTLKMEVDAHVTLTGDTGDDAYTAKIGTLNANSKQATVESSGKAVISTASNLKDGSTFTSDWNDTKIATSDITGGNIYTAAQLAGIKANTAYTLKTTITSSAKWTPVNLSGNFTADKLTVTVQGAPLFNKISGTAVIGGKDNENFMTLATGDITGAKDENNLGSLAKEVDGTVTVKFVKANTGAAVTIQGNTTQNKAENIGGLIGKANGTVTLQDVQIGAETKTVTLKGHANVGGFIGNVAGGTVKILTSELGASNVAFGLQGTYTEPADAKAGTFGNFIGSITGAGANVTIGGTTNAKGGTIAKFVNDAITAAGTNNLHYADNKNGTKSFVGMVGTSGLSSQTLTYEIGYSPVTAIGTILLYNKTTDTIGNPVSIKLEDINKFE